MEKRQIIGLYAGSFDPFTRGHMGIVYEAALQVNKLIIGIAINSDKAGKHLFAKEERKALIRSSIDDFVQETLSKGQENVHPNEWEAARRISSKEVEIEIDAYSDLTIDYAKNKSVTTLIRGVRPLGDHEAEMNLHAVNRDLARNRGMAISQANIPVPDQRYNFVSSSLIKGLAATGETDVITNYVYPSVAIAIIEKVKARTRFETPQGYRSPC